MDLFEICGLSSKSHEYGQVKTHGGTPRTQMGMPFTRVKADHVWEVNIEAIQDKVNPLLVNPPCLHKYPKNTAPFWADNKAKPTGDTVTRYYDLASRVSNLLKPHSAVSDKTSDRWKIYANAYPNGETKTLAQWRDETVQWNVKHGFLYNDELIDIIAHVRFAAFGPIRRSSQLLNGPTWFESANTKIIDSVMNFDNFV